MIVGKQEKQPIEVKDYPIDFSYWLTTGDTLTNVSASVACLTGSDASLVVTQLVLSSTSVAVWLAGGLDGQKYKISVTVTTAGGRIDQTEFLMTVKET